MTLTWSSDHTGTRIKDFVPMKPKVCWYHLQLPYKVQVDLIVRYHRTKSPRSVVSWLTRQQRSRDSVTSQNSHHYPAYMRNYGHAYLYNEHPCRVTDQNIISIHICFPVISITCKTLQSTPRQYVLLFVFLSIPVHKFGKFESENENIWGLIFN